MNKDRQTIHFVLDHIHSRHGATLCICLRVWHYAYLYNFLNCEIVTLKCAQVFTDARAVLVWPSCFSCLYGLSTVSMPTSSYNVPTLSFLLLFWFLNVRVPAHITSNVDRASPSFVYPLSMCRELTVSRFGRGVVPNWGAERILRGAELILCFISDVNTVLLGSELPVIYICVRVCIY